MKSTGMKIKIDATGLHQLRNFQIAKEIIIKMAKGWYPDDIRNFKRTIEKKANNLTNIR
jgi:hypothetical protein